MPSSRKIGYDHWCGGLVLRSSTSTYGSAACQRCGLISSEEWWRHGQLVPKGFASSRGYAPSRVQPYPVPVLERALAHRTLDASSRNSDAPESPRNDERSRSSAATWGTRGRDGVIA